MIVIAATLAATLFLTPVFSNAQGPAEDQVMRSFRADYLVEPAGTLLVTELIDWDFGGQQQHGIVRDLIDRDPCVEPAAGQQAPLEPCESGHDRRYRHDILSVERAEAEADQLDFEPEPWDSSHAGRALRLRIGDPDREVSGRFVYRLRYRVAGALTAYEDHDELFWDASGVSTAVMEEVLVTVTLPEAVEVEADCFEGYRSQARCDYSVGELDGRTQIEFAATRNMYPNEEVTILVGFPRGLVEIGPPFLEDRPSIDDYFELDALEFGTAAALLILGLAGVAGAWWRHGRDRQYRTLYYLTKDPSEGRRPLFARREIVVEYLPPDDLRPAQAGLILDERADPLDATATIVDLAVRGYLEITEIPREGFFGSNDWRLTKTAGDPKALLTYERSIYDGLFKSRTEVKLSDLKNTFYKDLEEAQDRLYADAMRRKWFPRKPETMRNGWLAAGIVLAIVGAGVGAASGYFWGRGIVGAPVVLVGLILAIVSRAMARRTATGSEALRRVLGFRLYVATAETRRQEFNEQQGIFARYLPYAIVFGCVEKWAKAFEGLDDRVAESTAGWYHGVRAFQVAAFSSSLQGFSSSISSTIASSPSSGGSGFSGGGFSGGGGGGGGTSSW
jgi:uncharacterized membrane protein YgcG